MTPHKTDWHLIDLTDMDPHKVWTLVRHAIEVSDKPDPFGHDMRRLLWVVVDDDGNQRIKLHSSYSRKKGKASEDQSNPGQDPGTEAST